MAGQGKRMRPHTLTTPKPLLPIAGQPMVTRLIEEIGAACDRPIQTIGFVVSTLVPAVQTQLTEAAQQIGAQAKFYQQSQPRGTAHAVLCAQALLQGPVIVAFADTLFKSTLTLATKQESVIWVKKVPNPAAFGVVQRNAAGHVTAFVEKPDRFISDLAIIGIYYFREGAHLAQALQQLIDQDLQRNGEYELTTALEAMKAAGTQFSTQEVDEWLDCGNKKAILHANTRFLASLQEDPSLIAPTAQVHNSILIPPVYLGAQAVISNAVVGPYVSVGSYSRIEDARVQHSLIQTHSTVKNVCAAHAMLGNHVQLIGQSPAISLGDYTTVAYEAS